MTVPVTKSFIPPIEEYQAQDQRAFDNGWLTYLKEINHELIIKLITYLEIKLIFDASLCFGLKYKGKSISVLQTSNF